MKAALFFAILLIPCTSFARMRDILVEVTTHRGGAPTVSIYSSFADEQRIDVSIAEASHVLERARQPGDGLDVSILVEGWIQNEPFWELLGSLQKNTLAQLIYVEVDRLFEINHMSGLSERGKRLQADFKTPEYTKSSSSDHHP